MHGNKQNNNQDDDESMKLAYQAFLLGGPAAASPSTQAQLPPSSSGKKKKKGKKGNRNVPIKQKIMTPPQPPSSISKEDNQIDEMAMDLACQSFLLGGGGVSSSGSKKKKKGKKHSGILPTPSPSSKIQMSDYGTDKNQSIRSPSPSSLRKNKYEQTVLKINRTYTRIVKTFQEMLHREWIDVDDNAYQVVSSITNLRKQISLENQQLTQMEEERKQLNNKDDDWKGYGYRRKNNNMMLLEKNDVEMALSKDMLQHEKMIAGLRTLLSSLGQTQESLGRRLDELMIYHYNNTASNMNPTMGEIDRAYYASFMNEWSILLEKCNEVYIQLGNELYRKQCLAQDIFDTAGDDSLLFSATSNNQDISIYLNDDIIDFHDDDDDDDDINPLLISELCFRKWPRSSKYSDMKDIDLIILKGNNSNDNEGGSNDEVNN